MYTFFINLLYLSLIKPIKYFVNSVSLDAETFCKLKIKYKHIKDMLCYYLNV